MPGFQYGQFATGKWYNRPSKIVHKYIRLSKNYAENEINKRNCIFNSITEKYCNLKNHLPLLQLCMYESEKLMKNTNAYLFANVLPQFGSIEWKWDVIKKCIFIVDRSRK